MNMELNAMQSNQLIEVSEQLTQLDPVRTYPLRAGETLAGLVGATGFRVERADGDTVTSEPPPKGDPSLSLPLRNGREVIGTLHLYGHGAFGEEEVRLTRWGARMIARGIAYCARLTSEGGRRSGAGTAAGHAAPAPDRAASARSVARGGRAAAWRRKSRGRW